MILIPTEALPLIIGLTLVIPDHLNGFNQFISYHENKIVRTLKQKNIDGLKKVVKLCWLLQIYKHT